MELSVQCLSTLLILTVQPTINNISETAAIPLKQSNEGGAETQITISNANHRGVWQLIWLWPIQSVISNFVTFPFILSVMVVNNHWYPISCGWTFSEIAYVGCLEETKSFFLLLTALDVRMGMYEILTYESGIYENRYMRMAKYETLRRYESMKNDAKVWSGAPGWISMIDPPSSIMSISWFRRLLYTLYQCTLLLLCLYQRNICKKNLSCATGACQSL